jgi:hypothetical protein
MRVSGVLRGLFSQKSHRRAIALPNEGEIGLPYLQWGVVMNWTKICGVFVCLAFSSFAQAKKNPLPDACGSDNVEYKVTAEKGQPAPAAPAEGKAMVIFVQQVKGASKCFMTARGCNPVTRFGMDGGWVGATKGNTYFAVESAPGVHHFCAVGGNDQVGLEQLTLEAGKVYYYQAFYSSDGTQYGDSQHPNYQVKKFDNFSILSDDEGRYRVKISDLAVSTHTP